MEELASVSWFLEQAKRQFQVLDIANIDRVEQKLPERKKRLLNPKTSNGAKRKRPRESLAVLIYQAMRHHQRKLTVAEISDFISDKYTYYKLRKHWTVSLSRILKENQQFKIVWTNIILLDYGYNSQRSVQRCPFSKNRPHSEGKQTRLFLGIEL